jgi:hypothetical protein
MNDLPRTGGYISTEENVTPNVTRSGQTLATESGHWYLPSGKPFYTIKGANGRERSVTIRDARKAGAAPSVTAITKRLASPGLQRYFEKQIFDAMRKLPQLPGETDEDYFERVRVESRQHAAIRAEAGTKLHGAIEKFLRGEVVSPEWLPHIAAIIAATNQYGLNLRNGAEPEKSFFHPLGFGGKTDYHERGVSPPLANGTTPGIVIDFKNKPTIEPDKKYGYEEHIIQLAAYREGLWLPDARCINIFVGVEDRKVLILEWPQEDLQRCWARFQHLLADWQIEKLYVPGEGGKHERR